MRRILTAAPQTADQTTVLIACPRGKAIRVLGVFGTWSGGTRFDGMELAMVTESVEVARIRSLLYETAGGDFGAGLALPYRPVTLAEIDPVTGRVNYDLEETNIGLPLPDIAFDHDVTITVNGISAVAPLISRATYEEMDV